MINHDNSRQNARQLLGIMISIAILRTKTHNIMVLFAALSIKTLSIMMVLMAALSIKTLTIMALIAILSITTLRIRTLRKSHECFNAECSYAETFIITGMLSVVMPIVMALLRPTGVKYL